MVNANRTVLEEAGEDVKIELIFINDSPDEKICFEDTQVYCNEKNLGIHASRIMGFRHSSGEYVLFLDQDDEISPSYLLRQMEYIGEADAVLCNGIYRGDRRIYKDIEQQRQALFKDIYIEQGNRIISPGQVLIKRKAIPDIWTRDILRENGCDDFLLWLMMLGEGRSFAINPFCDYIHKENGENTSLNFETMKRSLEELQKKVKDSELLNGKELTIFEGMMEGKIEKHEEYIHILKNWKKILTNIMRLINGDGTKRIAIYGYGILGKRLARDLECQGIKPAFVIDRAAENFEDVCYPIYQPEFISEIADLIIVTSVFVENEIKGLLREIASKVILLKEI